MLRGSTLPPVRFATLGEMLASAASSSAGLSFVDAQEKERMLSFSALREGARRTAGALRALGVREGDRVALVLPTGEDFMDAFFGAILAGAVPAPLYPPVRLGRLDEFHVRTARLLDACGARLVLTDRRVGRLLGKTVAAARPALGCLAVADLPRAGEFEARSRPEALAVVQFSSGTTVDPKPVALTHANALANLAAIDSFIPGAEQSGVSWLPLYHDMGLIGCLLLALYHPGNLALIPPELFLARPALWLRTLSRTRATITVAPNFAFGLCLKRVRDEDLAGCDLSALRLVLDGAEPIAPDVLRRFGERFARFGFDARAVLPVYGLSEASLAVTFSRPREGLRTSTVDPGELTRRRRAIPGAGRELVSVGVPVPGVDVRVVSEDGGEVPDGCVGRIEVRGPSVLSRYLGSPSPATRNGWLDTGDLGLVLGGELHVCGRAKEIIILRGANHAPQEFEDALQGLPGAREGCAVALGFAPDGGEGEDLLLLVERSGPLDEDEVRARVVDRTGIRPHTVRILEPGTLPRTSSGKLRRSEALRQFLDGTLRPPRAATTLFVLREAAASLAAFARLRLAR